MDELKRERFKRIISQLETSGGKNLNHKVVKTGMHAGDRAIGEYGLMPLTIHDVAKIRVNRGVADELDKTIAKMSFEEAKQKIPEIIKDNPGAYERYADTLADYVLKKYKDEKLAAFAWNQGHYTDPEVLIDRLQNPDTKLRADYLSRLEKAAAKVGDLPKPQEKKIEDVINSLVPNYAPKNNIEVPKGKIFLSPSDSYIDVQKPEEDEEESMDLLSRFRRLKNKLMSPEEISYRKVKREREES
jgi:hypothetical protein